jgi:hypothetical protein
MLGSLQHWPQPTQLPVRFLATGRTDVKVLLSFADHVFLFLLTMLIAFNILKKT